LQGSHSPATQRGWPPHGDLNALHAFTIRHFLEARQESLYRDEEQASLEARISAIEEVFAARWPLRWLLAARLRHSLRAATRPLETGGTFAARRAEPASLDVHPGHHWSTR
jgi:hypothetical protein